MDYIIFPSPGFLLWWLYLFEKLGLEFLISLFFGWVWVLLLLFRCSRSTLGWSPGLCFPFVLLWVDSSVGFVPGVWTCCDFGSSLEGLFFVVVAPGSFFVELGIHFALAWYRAWVCLSTTVDSLPVSLPVGWYRRYPGGRRFVFCGAVCLPLFHPGISWHRWHQSVAFLTSTIEWRDDSQPLFMLINNVFFY